MAASRHEGRRYLNGKTSDVRIVGCRFKNDLRNCQLLHRHCHDQKTTIDGSYEARGSGIQRGAV